MIKIVFLLFFAIAVGALASQLARVLYGRSEPAPLCAAGKPFVVSEYYERINRAMEDTLQDREPVDMTIILWWGLDGLTLDENGDLKWISRKKPNPVSQNVFYQTCQSIDPRPQYLYADNRIVEVANMCQSTQATIDALRYQNACMQMQADQQVQMQNLMSQIQNCCVQPPRPGYLCWNI